MSCTRRCVKTEHLVARTFFSVLPCRARPSTFDHAHVCMAQVRVQLDWWCSELCVAPWRIRNTSSSIMFRSTLLGVPETFSSLFLTVTDHTPLHDRWLESGVLRVLLPWSERQSGYLAESLPSHRFQKQTTGKSRIHLTTWNKPRLTPYWRIWRGAPFICVDLKSAQDHGLVFWQTNSNAIILNDSVSRLSGEGVKSQNRTNHESQDSLTAATCHQRTAPKALGKFSISTGQLVADSLAMVPKVDIGMFSRCTTRRTSTRRRSNSETHYCKAGAFNFRHPHKEAPITELDVIERTM